MAGVRHTFNCPSLPWFLVPKLPLGNLLQAKLLLGERIIGLLHQVAQAGAWERGKGGMRGAFLPYGLRAELMVRKTHPTGDFSGQFLMGLWPTRKA